jgi:choline-glycine betaine transporter
MHADTPPGTYLLEILPIQRIMQTVMLVSILLVFLRLVTAQKSKEYTLGLITNNGRTNGSSTWH